MGLNINLLNAGNYYGKGGAIKNSANVGESVATIFKQGRSEELKDATINYSQKDANGKVSIDGALAYSKASMTGLDKNSDGVIDDKDGIDPSLLKMIGGEDGKISNAENTGYTMFMDTLGGSSPDGVLTPEETAKGILPQRLRQQAAEEKLMGMTESSQKLEKQADELEKQYSEKIQGFVKGMKLEERDKALTMPKKSNTPGNLSELGLDKPVPQDENNQIIGLLKQILKAIGINTAQQSQCQQPQTNSFNFNSQTSQPSFNFYNPQQQVNSQPQVNAQTLNTLQQLVRLISQDSAAN
jgi:hypothetical protein